MRARRPLWLLVASCLLTSPASAEPAPEVWAGKKRSSWEELALRVKQARVVYVGEEHGKPKHHKLQRDVLAIMADAGPAVLGCEYFPRSLQPVLDRFNRGEISLAEFPKAVSWKRIWGHDWEAYAPLFRLCRERGVRVVALNAERELARRVRKEGLRSLELPELLALPRIDLQVEAHRARVVKQLQEVHPLPLATLEQYYEAFTLWDSVMADSVSGVLLRERRPNARMLVVAGRAHIASGTGIPDRVASGRDLPRLVVVCDSEGDAKRDQADFTVVFPRPKGGWY